MLLDLLGFLRQNLGVAAIQTKSKHIERRGRVGSINTCDGGGVCVCVGGGGGGGGELTVECNH